ncbi:CRISPR-associated endonuclease Cas2 [Desulfobotulus sp.]|uniref:CRISPR-associated endonuclease Cas2 n=1 Tax=Desulfobotulus sp. TaxID=1940337 RepID=UPI002A364FA2|nr:CRISPR-associated endonuclease Cas2 [Desulfobotulus sp.]MDY0162547.1 CRISPR-associated endonuclease Cas2 [Desulfobotulus sp.]
MMVLVSYDVKTGDAAGRRRLRRVAKTLEDYGQRVQYSVFECSVDPTLWVKLKNLLLKEIEPIEDSLRFYYMGKNWKPKVEHVGAKPSLDMNGPLIF